MRNHYVYPAKLVVSIVKQSWRTFCKLFNILSKLYVCASTFITNCKYYDMQLNDPTYIYAKIGRKSRNDRNFIMQNYATCARMSQRCDSFWETLWLSKAIISTLQRTHNLCDALLVRINCNFVTLLSRIYCRLSAKWNARLIRMLDN